MDKELLQQLNYASLMLRVWTEDPTVWDFRDDTPTVSVKIGEEDYDDQQVSSFAAQCKRNANYTAAVGAYLKLMASFISYYKKIPVWVIRSFVKVLISVNEFGAAFNLSATVLSDMQSVGCNNMIELNLFKQYFDGIRSLAVQVIDDNDFSSVLPFAQNYSGNSQYSLVKTRSEIIEELERIRQTIKQIYKY